MKRRVVKVLSQSQECITSHSNSLKSIVYPVELVFGTLERLGTAAYLQP